MARGYERVLGTFLEFAGDEFARLRKYSWGALRAENGRANFLGKVPTIAEREEIRLQKHSMDFINFAN